MLSYVWWNSSAPFMQGLHAGFIMSKCYITVLTRHLHAIWIWYHEKYLVIMPTCDLIMLHIIIIVLHADIDRSHVNINMLTSVPRQHNYVAYWQMLFACREQRDTTYICTNVIHINIHVSIYLYKYIYIYIYLFIIYFFSHIMHYKV